MFKFTKVEKFWLIAGIVCILIGVGISYAQASALGTSYIANGYVTCQVTQNPHKDSTQWGYVDGSGAEIMLGYTGDIGVSQPLGFFENEEIVFWMDGKNKRFYTGHGNNSSDHTRFVINGVKFNVSIDEGYGSELSQIETESEVRGIGDENDCYDYSVYHEQVKLAYLEARWSSRSNLNLVRIRFEGDNIDWNLYRNGQITIEVTLNDECESTFNVGDEIGYFNLPEKDFEGYRLTDYDYPESGIYPAKIRITKERGVNKHYLYINKVNVHDLVGTNVNVKVRLYQDGELIQAFEGEKIMTQVIK